MKPRRHVARLDPAGGLRLRLTRDPRPVASESHFRILPELRGARLCGISCPRNRQRAYRDASRPRMTVPVKAGPHGSAFFLFGGARASDPRSRQRNAAPTTLPSPALSLWEAPPSDPQKSRQIGPYAPKHGFTGVYDIVPFAHTASAGAKVLTILRESPTVEPDLPTLSRVCPPIWPAKIFAVGNAQAPISGRFSVIREGIKACLHNA